MVTQESSQYHPRSVFQRREVESAGECNEEHPECDGNCGAVQERPFLQMRSILKEYSRIKDQSGKYKNAHARQSTYV